MTQTTPQRSFRQRMGGIIVALHLSLLAVAVLYYFFKGFDLEELIALFAILAPVTALYGGIAFRSLGKKQVDATNIPVAHRKTIRLLIWGHFLSIGLLISLKALTPNVLNFKEMTILLGLVESYFGAHMGTLIHVIFGKGE
ncbi:MAG: hypothetical protein IPL49_01945 [Saprospirales bacterium]|nr:hypothetical protein [Saprospirales bacterium]MBK8489680.1 hypothetical protein [Saprospirales bacterium]